MGFVLFAQAHDTDLVVGAVAVRGLGPPLGLSLCVPGLKKTGDKQMRQEFPPTRSQTACRTRVPVCVRALVGERAPG